jgi:guanosine-3',5'-bis(diphosphate) 3'-pyrophosphohydrolase
METDEMNDSAIALLLRAATFAAEKHKKQLRKNAGGTPYINHPLAAADLLATDGGVTDVVVLAAAILHDTIEDTNTTREELEQRFGAEVAGVVAEVTDNRTLAPAVRKHLQIQHAPSLSPRAKLVKLADKICNIRDVADDPPPDWSLDRRRGYFVWAKSVVDGLRGVSPLLEARFDELHARRP